ncbi:MAG: hypothetical protein H6669_15865 [Ardenticatenaceae bacterium]|nr:hypothetical protein [Ardenticatenaceae bacterium]
MAVPTLLAGWLQAVRAAWFVLAAVVVVAIFVTFAAPATPKPLAGAGSHCRRRPESVRLGCVGYFPAGTLASASPLGLAAVFFRRRFTETVAAALSFYLLLYAVVMSGPLENWSTYWLGDDMLAPRLQGSLLAVLTVLLLALFPNGRFVPSWSRWLLPLTLPWSLGPSAPHLDSPASRPYSSSRCWRWG